MSLFFPLKSKTTIPPDDVSRGDISSDLFSENRCKGPSIFLENASESECFISAEELLKKKIQGEKTEVGSVFTSTA